MYVSLQPVEVDPLGVYETWELISMTMHYGCSLVSTLRKKVQGTRLCTQRIVGISTLLHSH